jgi:dTDP-4-dehydrorhamnose 3,5-epimerase-like enzyme
MRIPLRFHEDDRGVRFCDAFPEIGVGDINITYVYPGTTALWHRHSNQDDYQLVVKGALKIGMCNMINPEYYPAKWSEENMMLHSDLFTKSEREWHNFCNVQTYEGFPKDEAKVEWNVLSEHSAKDGPLFIPRGLWHGCHNFTNETAILIYHITNKYDGSDEDRLDPGMMGWDFRKEDK